MRREKDVVDEEGVTSIYLQIRTRYAKEFDQQLVETSQELSELFRHTISAKSK